MDKRSLVDQLASRLRETALVAQRAGADAAEMAREGATPSERRDDARVAIEYGGLARGQSRRAQRVRAELATLDTFRPQPLPRGARIGLGAIVEVESDEGQGRTFLLAPAGAGVELTTPDGDGFLSVVTPVSPLGRAVMGRCVGDQVEVMIDGEAREWTISYVE
jgi:transcription elongation GreA/GreB family factor